MSTSSLLFHHVYSVVNIFRYFIVYSRNYNFIFHFSLYVQILSSILSLIYNSRFELSICLLSQFLHSWICFYWLLLHLPPFAVSQVSSASSHVLIFLLNTKFVDITLSSIYGFCCRYLKIIDFGFDKSFSPLQISLILLSLIFKVLKGDWKQSLCPI